MTWEKLRAQALYACIVLVLSIAAAASTTGVIYSLGGDQDGEYADTDLVVDSAGNIYGTTVIGGDFGSGTVFQLTPSGQHNVLYSFQGAQDGGEPYKGVTLDRQGNLYGTAVTGGGGSCEGGCGVVYKVFKTSSGWRQTVVYAFTGGNDGSGPGSGVTIDADGKIYGMTPTGGAYGSGVVFQLSGPASATGMRLKVIHTFTGGDDGAGASAGRLLIRNGKIYGAATVGGAYGKGTAFELTPTQTGEWDLKTLYAFKGQPDAGFPYGGFLFDADGNLYGTTYYDGENNLGSVYELMPTQTGEWNEKVLYSFQGDSDGLGPISNLVVDKAGNLYGTTSEGGAGCSCGVIFKLSRDQDWLETVVYRFQGAPDGAFAYNGMVGDEAGNFYGATVHGGLSDDGTVYKFTP